MNTIDIPISVRERK